MYNTPDDNFLPLVVSKILKTIFIHRKQFLAKDVLNKLREFWSFWYESSFLDGLTPTEFSTLTSSLVDSCLSLMWVEEFLNTNPVRDSSQEFHGFIESKFRTTDALQFHLLVCPDNFEEIKQQDALFKERCGLLRDGMIYELGLLLPEISYIPDTSIETGKFRLRINDLRTPPLALLPPKSLLINEEPLRLMLLGLKGSCSRNPYTQALCSVIPDTPDNREVCARINLNTWDLVDYLVLHMSVWIRLVSPVFVTTELIQYKLEVLGKIFPTLCDLILEFHTIFEITDLLRNLIVEQISISDLKTIMEFVLTDRTVHFPREPDYDLDEWTTRIRNMLGSQICTKFSTRGDVLLLSTLDSEIENRLRKNIQLSPEELSQFHLALYRHFGQSPGNGVDTIITTQDLRKKVWSYIHSQFPSVRVISYSEIDPNFNIQPLGRIRWESPEGNTKELKN